MQMIPKFVSSSDLSPKCLHFHYSLMVIPNLKLLTAAHIQQHQDQIRIFSHYTSFLFPFLLAPVLLSPQFQLLVPYLIPFHCFHHSHLGQILAGHVCTAFIQYSSPSSHHHSQNAGGCCYPGISQPRPLSSHH